MFCWVFFVGFCFFFLFGFLGLLVLFSFGRPLADEKKEVSKKGFCYVLKFEG